MAHKIGSNDVTKYYIGESEVDKIYLGTTLVYQKVVAPQTKFVLTDDNLRGKTMTMDSTSNPFLNNGNTLYSYDPMYDNSYAFSVNSGEYYIKYSLYDPDDGSGTYIVEVYGNLTGIDVSPYTFTFPNDKDYIVSYIESYNNESNFTIPI